MTIVVVWCSPHFSLQALATTFNMNVPDLEKVLCSLIGRHKVLFPSEHSFSAAAQTAEISHEINVLEQVAARIDSVDKLLVVQDVDQRDKALKDITVAAEARVRVARGKVVAANVARVCQLQPPR